MPTAVRAEPTVAVRRDLPSLTSLRAFAALFVFAFHAQLWLWFPVLKPLNIGYAGVTVFFVLSGFILTWTHDPRRGLKDFYLRRFARIYPSHLTVVVVLLILGVVWGVTTPIDRTLLQIVLLQPWSPDPEQLRALNEASWSLGAEFFFYALFPFGFMWFRRLRKRTMWAMVGVALAGYATVVAVAAAMGDAHPAVAQYAYHNPAARLPEFLLGIAVGRSFQAGVRFPMWILLPGIAGAVALHQALPQAMPAANLWTALITALLLGIFAQRDARGRSGLLAWYPLQVAGRLSFAFYLVHLPLLVAMWDRHGKSPAVTAGTFAAAWVLATALHHGVEVPANRWIVRRWGRPRIT